MTRCVPRILLATACATVPQPVAANPLPAAPQAGSAWTNANDVVFRWCPPGRARITDQQGTHEVDFEGFWMGETEVTYDQAATVGVKVKIPEGQGPAHPLSGYTLERSPDIPDKMNAAGLQPEGWYYALPSEAEWEYACRAGSTEPYCFGAGLDQLPRFANFADRSLFGHEDSYYYSDPERDDGHATPAPAGSFAPNAWGLRDMHGNLWEACDNRVARGGAWCSLAEYCAAGFRHDQFGGRDQRSYIGLRILLRAEIVERHENIAFLGEEARPRLTLNLPLKRGANERSPLVVLVSTGRAKKGAHRKTGGIVAVLAREGFAVAEYAAGEDSNRNKKREKTVAGRDEIWRERLDHLKAACQHLANQAETHRIDMGAAAFMGNRAGASLAALAATHDLPLKPRALLLLNGSFQVGMHESNKEPQDDPGWEAHAARWSARSRLGGESPPAFVIAAVDSWVPHSGRRKPYEQAEAYAERLTELGVATRHLAQPEGRGSFDIGKDDEEFRRELLRFLRTHVARSD